jgi:hypothetical protein
LSFETTLSFIQRDAGFLADGQKWVHLIFKVTNQKDSTSFVVEKLGSATKLQWNDTQPR